MPFADEVRPVEVVTYRPGWVGEFEILVTRLLAALGSQALAIDHVGSTSVPGLPAKDVIDIQVRVASLDPAPIVERLEEIGFRRRPEPWNSLELSFGTRCEKLVFASPFGERACNVHVRVDGQPDARFALLFRDFLRANDDARTAWAEFKTRLAADVQDLAHYGQIKAPATDVLLKAASLWAAATGWGRDSG